MKGRKANPTEVPEEVKALEALNQKHEEQALEVEEIDRLYLPEGESYNLHVVMERAKFYQAQAANSLIELGKTIILLKAHEEHGQFLLAIEKLDISERSARYAMAAAQRFGNRQSIADLGRTKMMALTVLDDDSIQTLEDSGSLKGVGSLDEIEKMTVRELKAALRAEKKKRKEERDAQEAAISQKEQKLNELEQELRYRQPPTKEDFAQAKVDEISKAVFTSVLNASYSLNESVRLFEKACRVENVTVDQLSAIALKLGDHIEAIQNTLEVLGDYMDNPYPIKEELPCTENM